MALPSNTPGCVVIVGWRIPIVILYDIVVIDVPIVGTTDIFLVIQARIVIFIVVPITLFVWRLDPGRSRRR